MAKEELEMKRPAARRRAERAMTLLRRGGGEPVTVNANEATAQPSTTHDTHVLDLRCFDVCLLGRL